MDLRRLCAVKVADSIKKDKTIVFHSTRSREDLAEILLKKDFRPGYGGGAMLGPGFYANQHLYQAQKGNYGKNIIKAEVLGIENFLFLDKDTYEEVKGPASGDFIEKQLRDAGIEDSSYYDPSSTAQVAYRLWNLYRKELLKNFAGFVYSGNHDRESIVSWYPDKNIRMLEYSEDGGVTWKPVKRAEELMAESKRENLGSGEEIRSLQRAKDLVSKYEKYSDEKLANAINSQLSIIKDKPKKEMRKTVFKEYLEKVRPSVIPLIN